MREGSLDLLGLSASRPACLEIWYQGILNRAQGPKPSLEFECCPSNLAESRGDTLIAPNSNLSIMTLRDSKALA